MLRARGFSRLKAFSWLLPSRVRVALLLLAEIVVAGAAIACSPPARAPYPERISSLRAAKEEFFRNGSGSPVPPEDRSLFLPLSYFAIDESYVAAATLAPFSGEPAMEMPTSTGQHRQMRRAGTLKFSLKRRPLQLTTFVEAGAADMSRLFLPFGDMTNGTETYAAGRYLDLDRSPSGLYEIDFNLAYHPYCYYNPTYDCPYPPPENRLGVPVRAGERMRKTGD
jgi:uncharacterized protein (DUF1684 family)